MFAASKWRSIINPPPRTITFTERQLQKKFKHAAVLGISGNYNKVNAQAFGEALKSHVADPAVEQIVGTFRRRPVIHYLKESTRIDVITDLDSTFVSAWKLKDVQLKNLIERGSL